MRILVVDDDRAIQQALLTLFTLHGDTAIAVGDVPTARDTVFEAKEEGHPFQVAIIDGILPDLCREGWECGPFGPPLAAELRAQGLHVVGYSGHPDCVGAFGQLEIPVLDKGLSKIMDILAMLPSGVEG